MNPKASTVGIVYAQDGWPRISPDWVQHLTPAQRAWVDIDLREHGFRLTQNLEVEEIV